LDKTKTHTILFFITEDWYFWSHRLPIARAARDAGFKVLVATRVNLHQERIKNESFKVIPIRLKRRGNNPLQELVSLYEIIKIYFTEKPDIVHQVAVKPVLYGSIAAMVSGVPFVVNALAGLGFLFSSTSLKARLARPLIRTAFRVLFNHAGNTVILQNPDDINLLCSDNIVSHERVFLIRGSGVDTEQFSYVPEPSGEPVVIMASRLLWEKGVGEFIEAAGKIKSQGIKARFILVGKSDDENPSAISREQLHSWRKEGITEWFGHSDDMPKMFAESNIVCLPSYYGEGVPKVLIEAASCGRPIVTTDMPGCREIVHDSVNGFLVPARDPDALADALERLIGSESLRKEFGKKGRAIVIRDFSVEKVIEETLDLYRTILK